MSALETRVLLYSNVSYKWAGENSNITAPVSREKKCRIALALYVATRSNSLESQFLGSTPIASTRHAGKDDLR